MKYRNEYRYHPRYGHPEHVYTVVGRDGATHFHVTDLGEDYKHGERYSAGLEFHRRTAIDDSAPGTEKCWLLGGPLLA